MWCEKFKCTLSTNACIKRVNAKIEGLKKFDNEDSFITCKECLKGLAVIDRPECFINKDVERLIKQQEQALNKRSWKRSKQNEENGIKGRATIESATEQRNSSGSKQNILPSNRVRVKLKRKK